MFCQNCGAQIDDNAKFCESCGSPVVKEEKVLENVTAEAEIVEEPAAATAEDTYTPEETYAEQEQSYSVPQQDFSNANYGGYGQPIGSVQGESSGLAIGSMVCGIFSVVCCCKGWIMLFVGVAAVIMGIIVLSERKDGRSQAIAGIVCGAIGILMSISILAGNKATKNAIYHYFLDVFPNEEWQKELEELENIEDLNLGNL